MGVFYESIPHSLFNWILAQKVFWVATAPLSGSGHVNVSPKGGPDFFGLLDEKTFWYLDMTGSGSETMSHIYEPGNGRITIQFNAFEGPPRIVRLWGKGRVLENGGPEFDQFVERYSVQLVPGTRSIILVDIHQVGSSCGFSVPLYEFKDYRTVLVDYHVKKERKYKAGNEKESLPRCPFLFSSTTDLY
jgi:Pyridoxamine 5'-phosphate oxidase